MRNVFHMLTCEKKVTSTPGAKPGPQHQLEQQSVRASRVLTQNGILLATGSTAQIILNRQVCLRHILGFLLLMGFVCCLHVY